jgi:hypothetical protein
MPLQWHDWKLCSGINLQIGPDPDPAGNIPVYPAPVDASNRY